MSASVQEIVIGQNGAVRVAPTGTAIPTTPTATPDVAWKDLGLVSDKGLTVVDSKTLTKIAAWQLFYPARQIITARDMTATFDLSQWDRNTVSLAFGGGSFTTSGGVTKYSPPAPGLVDERMLMLDWTDGARNYRLVINRGLVTANVSTSIVRTAAAVLPITFSILGVDSGDPYELYTDDPAFIS